MLIEDVLAVELDAGRPVARPLAGEPFESRLVLSDDGRVELGIWEVTPGAFRTATDGYYEQMHFVAGKGSIIDHEGVGTRIQPGVVLLCPDGWSGVWEVEETIRKTYVIVETRA